MIFCCFRSVAINGVYKLQFFLHLFQLTTIFPANLGQLVPCWVLHTQLYWKWTSWISGTRFFYGWNVLPTTQLSVSKHWRKQNTL